MAVVQLVKVKRLVMLVKQNTVKILATHIQTHGHQLATVHTKKFVVTTQATF